VLVLLSVVKFDKQFIRECAGMIYVYLEGQKEKNLGPANELSSFLSTRLRLLDKKEQKKWLLLCISGETTISAPHIPFVLDPYEIFVFTIYKIETTL